MNQYESRVIFHVAIKTCFWVCILLRSCWFYN